MITLFRVDSRNNIVLNKNCVKLCPEFKNLTEEQVAYIVYAHDYNSPYKQFPERERKRKASYQVYGTTDVDAEKGKAMQTAIEAYIGMQYDPRRETIKAYKNKVERLNEQVELEENPKQIGSYMTAIDHLHSAMDRIQQDIDRDESKAMLKGGGELSLIEQLQEMKGKMNDYLKKRVKVRVVPEEGLEEVLEQVHDD